MLFLFGDESRKPNEEFWGIGCLITRSPKYHAEKIREIRKKCTFTSREMKFSSSDYSQILPAIRLFDYFIGCNDLDYKIVIKDRSLFDVNYYDKNSYEVDKETLSYLSTYKELTSTIKASQYSENKKILNYDKKNFVKSGILIDYLKDKDKSLDEIIPRDSKETDKKGEYTDNALLIQLDDLITGTIMSCFYPTEEANKRSTQLKNIYRKMILSSCEKMKDKLDAKNSYYYPSFSRQKMNIFYWRKR